MNTSKTAITLALTAALGTTGVAFANDNPFGMQVLNQGYQVAEADAKMPEGKCGAGMKDAAKMEDGKCGAMKDGAKAKDGKCGEGKCGAGTNKSKMEDGKCGAMKDGAKAVDGKCGAGKTSEPMPETEKSQ
jgi:uncharacterized low-complexity protein